MIELLRFPPTSLVETEQFSIGASCLLYEPRISPTKFQKAPQPPNGISMNSCWIGSLVIKVLPKRRYETDSTSSPSTLGLHLLGIRWLIHRHITISGRWDEICTIQPKACSLAFPGVYACKRYYDQQYRQQQPMQPL